MLDTIHGFGSFHHGEGRGIPTPLQGIFRQKYYNELPTPKEIVENSDKELGLAAHVVVEKVRFVLFGCNIVYVARNYAVARIVIQTSVSSKAKQALFITDIPISLSAILLSNL